MPFPAKIALCAFAMLLLGGLGGFVTSGSIDTWYATLLHPPGKPPNWLFGPVWSVLYLMIGTSFALLWHRRHLGKNRPTLFFALQLSLNLAWTPVFFGAHLIGTALVLIILLWLFVVLTIREFSRVSKPAALLLIPYLVWVTYAAYLNAGYTYLN